MYIVLWLVNCIESWKINAINEKEAWMDIHRLFKCGENIWEAEIWKLNFWTHKWKNKYCFCRPRDELENKSFQLNMMQNIEFSYYSLFVFGPFCVPVLSGCLSFGYIEHEPQICQRSFTTKDFMTKMLHKNVSLKITQCWYTKQQREDVYLEIQDRQDIIVMTRILQFWI